MKFYLIPTFALGLIVSSVHAQEKLDLTSPKQRASYAIGNDIASSLRRKGIDLDPKALSAGITDALAGKPALTPEEMQAALTKLQQDIEAKEKAKAEKYGDGDKNLKEGAAFLEANAKKEGVKTTASGLQYKVVKSGTGASPKKTDKVKVHYHGMLIDGTVFDSSVDRGQPVSFQVDGVIPGWIEALQLMKVGDKWQLFIPSKLAYGEQARSAEIGPNSALVFDVELLSIEKPN